MKQTISGLFADITVTLEDMHMIAVEGQGRDNTPDMHRVLTSQLRKGVASLDISLAKIKRGLGDGHD